MHYTKRLRIFNTLNFFWVVYIHATWYSGIQRFPVICLIYLSQEIIKGIAMEMYVPIVIAVLPVTPCLYNTEVYM